MVTLHSSLYKAPHSLGSTGIKISPALVATTQSCRGYQINQPLKSESSRLQIYASSASETPPVQSLHLTAKTTIVRNDVLCNTLRRTLRTRQASNPSNFTNFSLSKATFDQAPERWALYYRPATLLLYTFRMDTVCQAWKLQSLIDNKHQFARSINNCTCQLIQLAIGQSNTSLKPKEPYSPTKAVFQADLVSFAKAIFSTSPPPLQLSGEAQATLINTLTDVVKKQTRQLATKID